MNRLGLSMFTRRPAVRLSIGLGISAWAFVAAPAVACSDKFVVLGSGVRFERVYKSEHPTRVLLYMNPATELPQIDKKTHLRAALRFAGHKPVSVETVGDLERAMRKEDYGAILVSFSDSKAVEELFADADEKPLLVPVLFEPSDEELRNATKQYGCPITGTRKSAQMIETLDSALEAHGDAKACAKRP